MTQVTTGYVRLAVKDAKGNTIAQTEAIPLDIADNTSAPRLVIGDSVQGRPRGTLNDLIVDALPNLVAHSKYGEWLDLEVFVGTAFTLDTSDMTAIALNVADVWADATGVAQVEDRPLRLADRVTRTISGTFTDPRGLEDDRYVPADEWTPVLRYIPPARHNYAPRGYQTIQVHDNV